MKQMLLLVTLVTATTVVAVERQQLLPLIETAANVTSNAYVETRNKIVAFDKKVLPLLEEIALDENLPWQQQLVAHICHERIERKMDIECLLAIDWFKHPKYSPEWIAPVMGLSAEARETIWSALKEAGLWYHYLEVEWKTTGEAGNIGDWSYLCSTAVKDSPKRVWFLRMCDDLIVTPLPPSQLRRLCIILAREENTDVAGILEKYNEKYYEKYPSAPRATQRPAPPNTTSPRRIDFGTNPDGSKRLPPGIVTPGTYPPTTATEN